MKQVVIVIVLVLCVVLGNVLATPIETCPPGFLKHLRSCYRFSRFAATWPDAKAYCEAMRSHLASVTYLGVQRFLANLARTHTTENNYWIGGNDLAVEGDWRWVYDNSRFSYSIYASSQPDNGGQGEHCLALDGKLQYRWNDYACDKANYFICESHLIEDTRKLV